jgi:peptidoglycan/LPS O-acetylase OafA/YrhL
MRDGHVTTAGPATASTGHAVRNNALDGIRGMAALAVLFAHFVVLMGLLPYEPLGAMGVLMFFALSGYLIGAMCWRSAPTWSAYRTFVHRRVVRLAPVVLALVAVGGPALVALGGLRAVDVARDGVIAALQATAVSMAFGADRVEAFRPTWSLTVEWVFYLSFPLLLLALRRSGVDAQRATRVLAGIAAGLYAVGLLLPPLQFYVLPVANLGILVAGAALATWHRAAPLAARAAGPDPARSTMALVMLVLLVGLPGHSLSWGWKAAVFPATAVCTLVVIHGCWAGNGVGTVLARGPLRHVGLRAYSLYLWHVPIMWIVWVNMPASDVWVRAAVSAACIAVVVVASFELLERPVLRRSAGAPRRHRGRAVHDAGGEASVQGRERALDSTE